MHLLIALQKPKQATFALVLNLFFNNASLPKSKSLRDRRCYHGSHILLFTTYNNFGRNARLRGVHHPDIGNDLSAVDRLTQQLELVGGLTDRYVGAFQRL